MVKKSRKTTHKKTYKRKNQPSYLMILSIITIAITSLYLVTNVLGFAPRAGWFNFKSLQLETFTPQSSMPSTNPTSCVKKKIECHPEGGKKKCCQICTIVNEDCTEKQIKHCTGCC